MDSVLRQRVRTRAGQRCEYCLLEQNQVPFAIFHVDHIIAKQHGGDDDFENLALTCYHCNQHKGPNLAGIDPDSGDMVELYHPRKDSWDKHFAQHGSLIIGLTNVGRATVRVLAMNATDRIELRREL